MQARRQLANICPIPPLPAFANRQVRKQIDEFKVGAPARVGLVAPNDVTIPGGNTGMDPSQTSFFQVRSRAGLAAWCRAGQGVLAAAAGLEQGCVAQGW